MIKIRAAIASSQEEMINAQAAQDRDDALRAEREIALLREIESVSILLELVVVVLVVVLVFVVLLSLLL